VYGAVLLGSFNPETGKYYPVSKVGTGFSDETLDIIYKKLSPVASTQIPKEYDFITKVKPSYWIPPKQVFEIEFDSFSISPMYKIGSDKIMGGGISLRFPRFVKFRDDKRPDQSTSVEQLISLYLESAEQSGAGDESTN